MLLFTTCECAALVNASSNGQEMCSSTNTAHIAWLGSPFQFALDTYACVMFLERIDNYRRC